MEPPDAHRYDSGRELLKWIALATMTIDHIGMILYPQIPVLRIIGRISFPLFAYLLVLGMLSTHDPGNYFKRMLYFALLSQLPFAIANEVPIWQHLNIFFSLSLGIILIYLLDRNNILLLVPLIAAIIIPVDYGAYGLATILFLYIMRSFRRTGVILLIALNVLLIPFETTYQPLALLALPIILLHNDGRLTLTNSNEKTSHPLISKYFFYIYYPAHLLVLALIRTIQ
ncbi:MAG: TraX family protein [Candidatus Bathyarchaeota archaeon]|nr:TraX family protein [Candidatus Bathyarchaeota archaeon]